VLADFLAFDTDASGISSSPFGKSRKTSANFFKNSLVAEVLRQTRATLRMGAGF
jgi:hypothetical protein